MTVRLIEPGELFGHQAILSGQPYPGTAEALEDSILCFIAKNTLLKLMDRSHALALEVARQVSRELLKAEKKMQSLGQYPALARLAMLLLHLGNDRQSYASRTLHPSGPPAGARSSPLAARASIVPELCEGAGKPSEIDLSRRVLAEMVGITEESCVRILKRLKQQGIISSQNRKIELLDPKTLQELADGVVR